MTVHQNNGNSCNQVNGISGIIGQRPVGKWDNSVDRALWDSGISQWVEHCGIVGYLSE